MAPPQPVSWTGCYVDGGVGYGMWNDQHYGETFPGLVRLTGTATSGGEGWLGRVGGGCDYRLSGAGLSNWVVGAFADYDFMNLRSQNFAAVAGAGAIETESGSWAGGGRIGYLFFPNLMTFFSGGWTQARFDRQNLFATFAFPAVPAGAFIPAQTYSGWFLGGGMEYALDFDWLPIHGVFWRNEYRYSSYSAADLPILFDGGAPIGTGEHGEKTVQTITTSLVWRFNLPTVH
jgi:outer membrane immunogenic protein